MKWIGIILVVPLMALVNCGPNSSEKTEYSVNAKLQDKEEEIPVPKPKAVRCTKSMPPVCYDADGKRIE